MPIALNPDVSRNRVRAGTYIAFQFGAGGGELPRIRNRVLVLGTRRSTGTQPANAIYRAQTEQAVREGSGRRSSAYRGYRAAVAQLGGAASEVELYIGHVDPPSGGVASTRQLRLYGTATKPGTLRVWDHAFDVSVAFVTGDTAATIAAAVKAELDTLDDVPCTYGIATDLITATRVEKGAEGEDAPFQISITPGAGVRIGPGTVTFTNNVVGAGSFRITCGARAVTAAVSGGETPAQVVTLLVSALAAEDFALEGEADTADLKLYARDGFAVRRVTVERITSTGTTVAFNGGGAASSATNGVAGTGAPTLTTLITRIASEDGFGSWVAPWTDSTSLGALDDQVQLDGNGVRQRGEKLHIGSAASLANATTLVTDAGLDETDRAVCAHEPDAGVPAFELAARLAAARAAAADDPARNWRGLQLRTTADWPLLAPASSNRADDDDINAALLAGLCPIFVSGRRQVIDHGRTTFTGADRDRWFWSTIDQLDWQRDDARARLNAAFSDKMVKRVGEPQTSRAVDLGAIKDQMFLITKAWEARDLFDGADQLQSSIDADFDPDVAGRVLLQYAAAYLLPCNQIVAAGIKAPAAE